MKPERGFSLIEAVIAMAILSVALLGLALSIPVAVQANGRNRVDAEATMLAQRELEQIMTQPVTTSSFTDSNGNTVSLATGGAPLAGGKIDFSQATVNGYSATLTGTSGGGYELRWNVQSLADGGKQFTLAARRAGSQKYLLPPVNLSTRMGR